MSNKHEKEIEAPCWFRRDFPELASQPSSVIDIAAIRREERERCARLIEERIPVLNRKRTLTRDWMVAQEYAAQIAELQNYAAAIRALEDR